MPKFIGYSAIVGFLVSVVLLFSMSYYAFALRTALVDCRKKHTAIMNGRTACENKLSATQGQVSSEQRKIARLETRLNSIGAPHQCVSLTHDAAAAG